MSKHEIEDTKKSEIKKLVGQINFLDWLDYILVKNGRVYTKFYKHCT